MTVPGPLPRHRSESRRRERNMSNDLYELLKAKDREIDALNGLVVALRAHIAEAAAEHARSEAWKEAYDSLGALFYEHGFKSDGSFRG